MESLNQSTLHWADDGELIASDRLILLNSLVPESIPEVQIELIQAVECLSVQQLNVTAIVSES